MFGEEIKPRKRKLESMLAKYDRDSFQDRLSRLQFLNKHLPHDYGFLGSFETIYIFDEAKMAFINGEFVSTIMLAQAFIEHKLQGYLASKGRVKESKEGLKNIVNRLRSEGVLLNFLA